MKELLMALMLWIGANTDYNVDLSLPEIIRMDKAPLEYQYFKGTAPVTYTHLTLPTICSV